MALCVCKCLNVSLESEKFEDIADIGKLELTPTEQRDIFFSETLLLCPDSVKSVVAQQSLTSQREVGRWCLHSCLACDQTTHATIQERPNQVLINKNTLTTIMAVNNLKRSSNFSPIFNLLIPELTNDVEMKENIDTNNLSNNDKKTFVPTQHAIGSLKKQLSQTLQSELEAVEETVRQFRDLKYAEFEAFRERAQRDHKILASIIHKARGTIDCDSWNSDESADKGPLSPQLPPLQRRRLSSFKDAKKFNQNIVKTQRNIPPEEDSLDVEDIFDFEGTDSNMSRNDMNSDQDDYDSDNSVSNDEGIHIGRGREAVNNDIARSLPINMPKFPTERLAFREQDDEAVTQDIEASIKALARSVHGDVYELPRPRFSTRI